MDVVTITTRFESQEACIEHLERVRFGDDPYCPLCGVVGECAKKKELYRVGRWNCHSCKSSFNVLSGTVFQGTHIPLKKWFMAIRLIMRAKENLSSHQLSRELNLNQKSAWFMQRRIQAEMGNKQGVTMLEGIAQADETHIGGRTLDLQ